MTTWNPTPSAIALALALGACASVPPPTEQMAVSRAAVADAQGAGAGQYAPDDLREAQSKLTAATAAMARRDNEQALRLAEQAEADAQLAAIRARSAKATAAVIEVQESIRTLQNELQRRSN